LLFEEFDSRAKAFPREKCYKTGVGGDWINKHIEYNNG
jgi:hypothetical protein